MGCLQVNIERVGGGGVLTAAMICSAVSKIYLCEAEGLRIKTADGQYIVIDNRHQQQDTSTQQ